MSVETDKIFRDFSSLPQDAQQQVVDFIAFLQTRYAPAKDAAQVSQKKLMDEAFVGIWNNRNDMQDSSAWVRNTRQREWGNQG